MNSLMVELVGHSKLVGHFAVHNGHINDPGIYFQGAVPQLSMQLHSPLFPSNASMCMCMCVCMTHVCMHVFVCAQICTHIFRTLGARS